jgi:hypothetical protein
MRVAPFRCRPAPDAPSVSGQTIRRSGGDGQRAAAVACARKVILGRFPPLHLSYVHADFYRPRYLMPALASGGLQSTTPCTRGG